MGWVRFDDAAEDHPKFLRAGLAAEGLHKRAACYSARHLTDGFVPAEWVDRSTYNLKPREKRELIAALLRERLFEEADGGFLVHDYLDYNPSRADVLARRAKDSARKTNGIAATSEQNPNGIHADSKRSPNGSLAHADAGAGAPAPASRPHPSLTTTSSSDVSAEDESKFTEEMRGLAQLLADRMLANDPKAKTAPATKGWLDPIRLLIERDGRSADEVRRIIEWCQADTFWRSNILSPSKLRTQFTQLTLRMQANGVQSAVEAGPLTSDEILRKRGAA